MAWSEKVCRVVSAESGVGGVAGKGGAQGSPKSPRKLSSRTEAVGGAIPPAEATERPQAPSFLTVPLRLYNVRQRLRQLRLPLTDKLLHVGSGAAQRVVISDFPISQRPYHVMSNQRRASARGRGAKEPCRSRTPLPRLPAARLREAAWWEAGPSEQLQGRSSAHAVGFSRSHACTQRKAAEKVI